MHRFFQLVLVTTLMTGCQLGCLGIELGGGHPLKPEGICASRGGSCGCDGNVGPFEVSRYPQLDCARNPLSCPAVCYRAGDFDDAGLEPDPGPDDPRVPRLIVASSGASSLSVWNNADTLLSDAAPAENLPVSDGATALSRSPGVLVVGLQTMGIDVFDAPRSLDGGTGPRASIAVGDGASVRDVSRLENDLWILMSTGSLHKLANFTNLTSASTSQQIRAPFILDAMTFVPFTGPTVVVSDASSGKVLMHSISEKPELHAWGEVFLSPNAAHRLARGGATLFSADNLSGSIELRPTKDLLAGPFVSTALTLGTGLGSVVQLKVQHDVLVVVGTSAVGLYTQASTIIARKTQPAGPDFTVSHPTLGVPIDAMLGADDMLYVLDSNGVSIFRDATGQAVFVTEITSGISNATALTLIE